MSNPSNGQEWAAKAQELQSAGKYAEAAAAYDKVLQFAPNIAEVHLNKGVVLSAASRDSEALQAFDKAIELKPTLAGAHCNRGNIMKSSGRPKDAMTSYQEAVKLDPSMQTAWFGLAHVLNEQDMFEKAIEAANKSIELNKPKVHAPSHNERVFSLLKLNRGGDALGDIDALCSVTPMEAQDAKARKLYSLVWAQTAVARADAGKPAEAMEFYGKAAGADPTFQNTFNFAISLIQSDKQDDALVQLKKAKALDASNWKVHGAIGTICMQKKDFAGAAEAFGKAVTFPEVKEDYAINYNLGIALMTLGNEKDAREPLERAAKQNRDNWTAQALLGTIYIGQGDFKKAEAALRLASTLPGGDTDSSVWYNLGYAQLMSNNGPEALTAFNKAVEIDPSSAQAKSAVEALTAKAEVVKESVDHLPKEDMLTAEEKKRFDQVADDPVERAKILVAPQRPAYLRRKSMEGIVIGRVFELKTKFEMLALEKPKG